MGSWARRTGFKGMERGTSNGSDIEINLSDGTHIPKPSTLSAEQKPAVRDLESGAQNGARNGVHANGMKEGNEKEETPLKSAAVRGPPAYFNPVKTKTADSDVSRNNSGQIRIEPLRLYNDQDDAMSQSQDGEDHMIMSKHLHMKYELRENPGLGKFSQVFSISFEAWKW